MSQSVPSTQNGAPKDPTGVKGFLHAIGGGFALAFAPVAGFLHLLGEHLMMLGRAIPWTFRPPFRVRLYLEQLEFIGVGSLPIITLVGGFSGMVTSLQAVSNLKILGAEGYAGAATGVALSTELGPVLTALMLSGRAGAGIATELGTMRITEQIDALEAMAVNPIQYLVVPRLVAGLIMGPVLTLLFFGVGMAGGYFVAVKWMGVDHGLFVSNLINTLEGTHVLQGLIKSTVFGVTFALIGCYQGYTASGGGRGVGLATTRTVVVSSVAVLILNYFMTDILLIVFPLSAG